MALIEPDKQPHDEACVTEVYRQHVVEIKPDGSEVHMTPKAAVETAQGLIEAAARADGERRLTGARDQAAPLED